MMEEKYSYEMDYAVRQLKYFLNHSLAESNGKISREAIQKLIPNPYNIECQVIQMVLQRWERLGAIEILGTEDLYVRMIKKIPGWW